MSGLPPASLVLAYPRVGARSTPYSNVVEPERFAEQLGVLARLADVVPVQEITGRQVTRHGRRLRVAITLDDGYAGHGNVAAPLLRDAGLPATFPVVARALHDHGELWWDRLEHLVFDTTDTPDALVLDIGGRVVRIDIRSQQGRGRAHAVLRRRLRSLPAAEIATLLEAVRLQLGADPPRACDAHRPLTSEEVRRLADDPLFEVAGHGMTHTMLGAGGITDVNGEVTGAKQALEQAAGRPVRTFAYPHAGDSSPPRAIVRCVREAGFDRALTTMPGLVGGFADRFRVPRFTVEDWTGEQLEERLREWVAA